MGKTKALLIGINRYRNMEDYDNLASSNTNVKIVKMGLERCLKLSPENIKVCKGLHRNEINKGELIKFLNENISDMNDDDTLILYFTGHGDKGKIVLSDGSMTYQELMDIIEQKQIKNKVLILDCCYAGSFDIDKIDIEPNSDMQYLIEHGYALMASCSENEENKMNCYELYAIGCAEKYIEPEQTGLLFEKDYRIDKVQDFTPSKRRCKEIGKNYIKSILKQKVTEEVLYEFDFFIDDYVEMAMELKERIDIKAGKKKIRKLHDKYAERLLKKKHRGKIKIPETPLKYLKLPKEFILLDAPGALCQEQKRQHNCVSSYIGRIEKGSCIIYSADINGEHVTIEIRYRKTRGKYTFIVPQCLKMWNECCSEETLKYVKEQVKEAGEQAVKKYERKIERKAKNQ